MAKKNLEIVSRKSTPAVGKIARDPRSGRLLESTSSSGSRNGQVKTVSSISKRELQALAEKYEDALERLAKR
jgi:hypothetical protein